MEIESFIRWLTDFGYMGLFLYLWVGIFAFPIPNEILIISISIAASNGMMHPIWTFITAYFGIVGALTTAYLLGRVFGRKILMFLIKKPKFKRMYHRSNRLLKRYHAFSLSISYFIPGIRLLLPFIFGFSKLPFKKFALYAYSGAMVWLCTYYITAYFIGDEIKGLFKYEKGATAFFVGTIVIYVSVKLVKYWRLPRTELGKQK
ncbi:DedA family protein [Peribacillus alkalitolerans]|uniref:DedA family protein n=1 Tax=Peribacillus alkalitolerans TaxID=1550385 RepID=UPI0013D1E874|nr:VTT domain-containing protein [Peribacillus alkalitolerans]